jgi:hypothetical protein
MVALITMRECRTRWPQQPSVSRSRQRPGPSVPASARGLAADHHLVSYPYDQAGMTHRD